METYSRFKCVIFIVCSLKYTFNGIPDKCNYSCECNKNSDNRIEISECDISDMSNVVKKLEDSGNRNIMLCERGTSFGYNTLVVDMTGISEMKKFGYPVVFDATHSVQKPGGNGNATGGNRNYVEPLAKAAIAAGADALFFEVHPNPDNALSDGSNMVRLDDFENMLIRIKKVYDAVR